MDEDAVLDLLREVEDPDLGEDIVSLRLVNEVTTDGDSVSISLALGAPYSPNETAIAGRVREVLGREGIDAELSARVDRGPAEDGVLPDVKNVIAVASGKGGVGKSTVAVNLAAGLSAMGAHVGLFDADVYGPNVPRMVAADEHPQATQEERIIPPEKYGMKLMSMAFLVGEDDPVIWRGPMIHKIITQLTLLQTVPVTGAVIVTTPQDVAVDDARKGLRMFGRHDTPVVGIVENMSGFLCPDCGAEHDIFGEGGGGAFAEEVEMPFLGEVPLDPSVREGGDEGGPAVLDEGETTDALQAVVERVANNVGVLHRRRQSQQ